MGVCNGMLLHIFCKVVQHFVQEHYMIGGSYRKWLIMARCYSWKSLEALEYGAKCNIIFSVFSGTSSNSSSLSAPSPDVTSDANQSNTTGDQSNMLVAPPLGALTANQLSVTHSTLANTGKGEGTSSGGGNGQGARPKLRPLSQTNRRRGNGDQNGNTNGKADLYYMGYDSIFRIPQSP